jgi:hypothetical protein
VLAANGRQVQLGVPSCSARGNGQCTAEELASIVRSVNSVDQFALDRLFSLSTHVFAIGIFH